MIPLTQVKSRQIMYSVINQASEDSGWDVATERKHAAAPMDL